MSGAKISENIIESIGTGGRRKFGWIFVGNCDKELRNNTYMTPPFLFLLAAAGIFRLLSADAKKAFDQRLANLLPRKVMEERMRVLLAEYTDRLSEFRRRVMPFSALQVLLNAAACACFAAALWFFPPTGMAHWDLVIVRYGSVLLTPVAFVADVVLFARTLLATFARDAEADGAI
jgi:hypothetical protein